MSSPDRRRGRRPDVSSGCWGVFSRSAASRGAGGGRAGAPAEKRGGEDEREDGEEQRGKEERLQVHDGGPNRSV